MEEQPRPAEAAIDLGAASERTQGPDGRYVDLVRYMEHWGISND